MSNIETVQFDNLLTIRARNFPSLNVNKCDSKLVKRIINFHFPSKIFEFESIWKIIIRSVSKFRWLYEPHQRTPD